MATTTGREAQQVEHASASGKTSSSSSTGSGCCRAVRNEDVTEIEQIPNRGHSLTIDSGWREVAETALAFVKRFV